VISTTQKVIMPTLMSAHPQPLRWPPCQYIMVVTTRVVAGDVFGSPWQRRPAGRQCLTALVRSSGTGPSSRRRANPEHTGRLDRKPRNPGRASTSVFEVRGCCQADGRAAIRLLDLTASEPSALAVLAAYAIAAAPRALCLLRWNGATPRSEPARPGGRFRHERRPRSPSPSATKCTRQYRPSALLCRHGTADTELDRDPKPIHGGGWPGQGGLRHDTVRGQTARGTTRPNPLV
jgi:hypothetical protein